MKFYTRKAVIKPGEHRAPGLHLVVMGLVFRRTGCLIREIEYRQLNRKNKKHGGKKLERSSMLDLET